MVNLKLEWPDGTILDIPGGCKIIYEVGASHGDEVIDSEVYPIDDTCAQMLAARDDERFRYFRPGPSGSDR